MSLKKILKNSKKLIQSGTLRSEAQARQAVITPILRELGWDDLNPQEIWPEFPVLPHGPQKQGWVDYALRDALRPRANPLVFIEAKSIGKEGPDAERQLFDYADNQGIPLLIMSSGRIWDFYLSMAEGVPAERMFRRMDLWEEGRISEYAKYMKMYLRKARIVSGKARLMAEDVLRAKKVGERQVGKLARYLIKRQPGLVVNNAANYMVAFSSRPEVRKRRIVVQQGAGLEDRNTQVEPHLDLINGKWFDLKNNWWLRTDISKQEIKICEGIARTL